MSGANEKATAVKRNFRNSHTFITCHTMITISAGQHLKYRYLKYTF